MANKSVEYDSDPVNHPQHYTNSAAKCAACGCHIECIDITRHMSFNIGNAVKYLWRYQDKNGLEDLKKARWYLDDAIKHIDGFPSEPPELTLALCIHGAPVKFNNCPQCNTESLNQAIQECDHDWLTDVRTFKKMCTRCRLEEITIT